MGVLAACNLFISGQMVFVNLDHNWGNNLAGKVYVFSEVFVI